MSMLGLPRWLHCTLVLIYNLGLALFPTTAVAGEIHTYSFQSIALGRTFNYAVYQPTAHAETQRYPVFYLLHGAGGSETSWAREGRIEAIANRLIADGQMKPMLIVMPGAGDCWWVDIPACRMESMFWNELVPAIAARGDALADRTARAIAGISAGGHGALRLSLIHPERFAAAALLSPAIYAGSPPGHSKARSNAAFLDSSGRFDTTLWQAANYTGIIAPRRADSGHVAYYIVCGDRDEYDLSIEATLFHRQLTNTSRTAAQLRILDGDHNWQFWELAIVDALRFISDRLEGEARNPPIRPTRTPPTTLLPQYGRR